MSPRSTLAVFSLILILIAMGCQRIGLKNSDAPQQAASLQIKLDKADYRPGELVKIEARLINGSGKAMRVRALDPSAISFFYSMKGKAEPMERQAVTSAHEQVGVMAELPAGGSLDKVFLLTRLTFYSGPMKVVAIYDPNSGDARLTKAGLAPKISSNTVDYKVEGKRLFDREVGSGLIKKEEAERLAAEAAGGKQPGAKASESVSFLDEMGFQKWYVNVRSRSMGGIDELTGWIVNPYTGTVLEAARPFDPKLAADRHIIRKSSPRQAEPVR